MAQGVGLPQLVADAAVNAERSFSCLRGCRIISCHQPHGPQVAESVRLTKLVTEASVNVQSLLQHLYCCRVIPSKPSHVPKVAEGVRLAEPVAEVPRELDRGLVAGDRLSPWAVVSQQPAECGGHGGNS